MAKPRGGVDCTSGDEGRANVGMSMASSTRSTPDVVTHPEGLTLERF